MAMKYGVYVLLMFVCLKTAAQDNYEIQVYGAQTQAKHSTMLSLIHI